MGEVVLYDDFTLSYWWLLPASHNSIEFITKPTETVSNLLYFNYGGFYGAIT